MTNPTIVIAAFDRALPSGLSGIADMFTLSCFGLAHSDHAEGTLWAPDVIIASQDGAPIHDGAGREFDVHRALPEITRCDAVLIPGFVPDSAGLPPATITDPATRSWLAQQHSRGALICSSCSGAFVIGESGLLNGRRCTTTWWLHDELRRRFYRANPAWGSGLIADGCVVTAGGPLSWVDISLHVIRTVGGHHAAKLTADFAVVDTAPKAQAIYAPQGHLAANDPFLANAEHIVRQSQGRPLSTRALAAELTVSERTLHRKLKRLTGEAPKAFIDRVRVDQACTLLQTTTSSIKSIGLTLGYSDESVFRRLFRRRTGMTPTAYRRWLQDRKY
ncbi:MAG: GlxA family transcriptional regulator [Gammaproteobacteria bacterium]